MKKRLVILLFLALLIAAAGFVWARSFWLEEKEEFKTVFFDVGQGDASLIKIPGGKTILIDAGPDNLVLNRLGEYLPFYRRTLDLIIISHWHDDHIIGLQEIIERYHVKSLIYMEGAEQSELARDILDKAVRRGVRIIPVNGEIKLNYNGCSLDILSALSLGVKENSNNSLITLLDCRGLKFLFSGDNESIVEKKLLASGRNYQVDIFKASHHGSKTANTREFLETIKPKLVVISVGKDNRFNHPAPEVVENMGVLGLKIKRTDIDSSIEIRFNQGPDKRPLLAR